MLPSSQRIDIAFIVVMSFGWLITMFIVPPERVIRSDGSSVVRRAKSGSEIGFRQQLDAFIKAYANWKILTLIPML